MPHPVDLGGIPARLGLKLGCGLAVGGAVGLAGVRLCAAFGWSRNVAAAAAAVAAVWAGTWLAARIGRRLGVPDREG